MYKLGLLPTALGLLLGAALLAPAPATAETGTIEFTVDDQTEPELDLVSMTTTYGGANMVSTVRVEDLTDEGVFHIGWERHPFNFKVFYVSLRMRDGELKVHYTQLNDGIRRHPHCDGAATWDAEQDLIRVRVPQTCWIGRVPRTVKAWAFSERPGQQPGGDRPHRELLLDRG